MECPICIQLDRCCEHDAESNDADASKYLTNDRNIAVADSVTIAQQQSAATLPHNMQMAVPSSPGGKITPHLIRSWCHHVRMSRAQLTVQLLQGFSIDDSFGSFQAFS